MCAVSFYMLKFNYGTLFAFVLSRTSVFYSS